MIFVLKFSGKLRRGRFNPLNRRKKQRRISPERRQSERPVSGEVRTRINPHGFAVVPKGTFEVKGDRRSGKERRK